jgi:hypothetical protein
MTCSEFKTCIYVVRGPGGNDRLTRGMNQHARRCERCHDLWIGIIASEARRQLDRRLPPGIRS